MQDTFETVRWYLFLFVLCAGGLCSPSAWAQEKEKDGEIAVTGIGQSRAKPNAIEMEVNLSAKSELVEDAMVKFKESRSRLVERLTKLDIAGLKILQGGVRIGLDSGNADDNQMVVNNGQPTKADVCVASSLRVRIDGVRETKEESLMSTISKLMDTIKDAGASLVSSNSGQVRYNRYGYQMQSGVYVRFLVTDVETLRNEAFRKASENALQSAKRLAGLHGVKLGKVRAVQDQQSGHFPNQENPGIAFQQIDSDESAEGVDSPPPMVSESFGYVYANATIAVRYDIVR
jgi:uncharacterized protein YggE